MPAHPWGPRVGSQHAIVLCGRDSPAQQHLKLGEWALQLVLCTLFRSWHEASVPSNASLSHLPLAWQAAQTPLHGWPHLHCGAHAGCFYLNGLGAVLQGFQKSGCGGTYTCWQSVNWRSPHCAAGGGRQSGSRGRGCIQDLSSGEGLSQSALAGVSQAQAQQRSETADIGFARLPAAKPSERATVPRYSRLEEMPPMTVPDRAFCSMATASCRELPCTMSFASSESKNGNIVVPVSTQVSTLAPAERHLQLSPKQPCKLRPSVNEHGTSQSAQLLQWRAHDS